MNEFLVGTNILVSVIGGCVMIISFFLVRTLQQVDKSQTKLFDKFEDHEQRLSHIEGEHAVFTGGGTHK